ncbi:hypothetical protein DOE51_00740 [Bdellovibrio sp. NC01]|nr:hypothetical protein DOE51_00740 [Bdellovibrio sp. NC01]
MNKSNNPLTPMAALNLHDYITSKIYGTDEDSNSFFLRGALPHKLFNTPQIARLTVPYSTVPDPAGGSHVNGMGDINLFDIFLMGIPDFQVGIGPYFVFPTASKDETGSGKWQIGAAATVIHPDTWGMVGALLTYQHDYAGDEDRPTQNIATLQPFLIFNLPTGFYLRSTGIMNFNLETGQYYVPIGFGLGKVWKFESGITMNLFAEPQWTLYHKGDGYPEYQTFVGLNFQFPLGGHK